MGLGATGSKTARGIMANIAMASSLVKKIESTSIVDSSKASSNGESGENKYSNGMP